MIERISHLAQRVFFALLCGLDIHLTIWGVCIHCGRFIPQKEED